MKIENMTKYYLGAPYHVTETLTVRNPTVKEIIDFDDDKYYSLISMFLSTPYRFMVQLDDIGIDFTKVSDFEFFGVFIFPELQEADSSILFEGSDFKDFNLQSMKSLDNKLALYNAKTGEYIDEEAFNDMREYIMNINFIQPENRINPGNERTRINLIRKERDKQKRMAKQKKPQNSSSFLYDHISALVWASSHTFEQIVDLHIYQFNEGLKRIQKIKGYDQIMNAVGYGNLKLKDVDEDSLNWFGEIQNKRKDVTFNVS